MNNILLFMNWDFMQEYIYIYFKKYPYLCCGGWWGFVIKANITQQNVCLVGDSFSLLTLLFSNFFGNVKN